ncbi:MAG: hypothetical protein WA002_02195 [Candidatus Acidiferrales bacterium]
MRLGKTLTLGIFGLCAGALLAMPQSPRVTSQLVIQDVTVIDAASGTSRAHMTIAIPDEKIERVEKYSGGPTRVPIPPGTASGRQAVMLGHARFVIPELWDMHTHVAGVSAQPRWSRDVLLPLLVANGITGIRDMGGDLDALQDWRRKIERGDLVGPEIVTGGPMLLPAEARGGGRAIRPEQRSLNSVAWAMRLARFCQVR